MTPLHLKILLAFLFIQLTAIGSSFAQGWELINPLPTEAHIEKFFFVDDQIGWAQAYNETLLFTSDGGSSWQTLYPDLFHLDIQFLSENVGWGIAQPSLFQDDRQIYKTTDGGHSWQLKAPNEFVDHDIFFLNHNLGWAGGSRRILHTKDGGANWEEQAVSLLLGRGAIARSVLFLDSLNGWAVTTIDVIKTTDGGASWEIETAFPFVTKFSSFGESHIWGIQSSSRTVWRSTNGGANWESFQFSDTTGFDLRTQDIYALDENTLFIATNYGVYSSLDDGENWIRVSNKSLSTIWALTSLDLWGGREFDLPPRLYNSTDGGNSWVNMVQFNSPPNHQSFVALDFVSEDIGFIAGGPSNNGFILKTLNGGDTWNIAIEVPGASFRDLDFADALNGWVVGEEGAVYHTNNGGQSWIVQTIATPYLLNEVSAVDSLHAWAVGFRFESDGFEGKIWATQNGGLTWEEQTPGLVNSALYSVCFLDTMVGWAAGGSASVGSSGNILKTSDGGQTWETQRNQFGLSLYDIEFLDDQYGWFAGEDPATGITISRTMDGGTTWISASNINAFITELEFVTPSDGWALGIQGRIFRTLDGGEHWDLQETNTFSTFEDITMMNRYDGIAISDRGTILQTETGGVTGINPISSSSQQETSQLNIIAFPNPFNSSLKIRIDSIDILSEVKIIVYDVLGQNIEKLYHGPIIFSETEFTWKGNDKNGQSLPSGLYFIQISNASKAKAIKVLKVN